MYPVMLNVEEQSCLVVGGGGVALRKVQGLLGEGATVTVVAAEPVEPMTQLAEQEKIRIERRSYRQGEAGGYALVFAATDDREINRQVFADAKAKGIWVNVADDPDLCTFHLPARVQRGALQMAVASAGLAPFVVRRLRQLLEKRFGLEWAEWMEAAARFRDRVLAANLEPADKEQAFDAFFAATVNDQQLMARIPSQAEEASWLGRASAGPEKKRNYLAPAWHPGGKEPQERKPGRVSLVGGGPGDPGLLTLLGRQRLLEADAVVYDRLAATALPCDLPARVELHCVGKQAGHHPVPQTEITELLLRLARQGMRVVRLKGGDPYVFGRGGEEAETLAEAGIPFEVVPSVTAGIAVPAYAGIPVTFRNEVVRVTLVTAHEADKQDGPQVRWDLLAADPHATIIGYMGVTSLPSVMAKLLAAGMKPDTPAALLERGTTSRQRVLRSTISCLVDDSRREGMCPPALFVVGPSIKHADKLDWFSRRPLLGERLVLVSPTGDWLSSLQWSGVEVVPVPLPVTPAARVVMGALPLSGCLFRSAAEVEALDEERDAPGWNRDMTAWCLGADTAAKARQCGWRRVCEFDPALSPADLVEQMMTLGNKTGS